MIDAHGQLWGATNSGTTVHSTAIDHIDTTTGKHVETVDMSNHYVYGIAVDPDGVVWASDYQTSLMRYDSVTRAKDYYSIGGNMLRGVGIDRHKLDRRT